MVHNAVPARQHTSTEFAVEPAQPERTCCRVKDLWLCAFGRPTDPLSFTLDNPD